MSSATASTAREGKPGGSAFVQINLPRQRDPIWLDGIIFFIGIPFAIAFIFSLVGIRLTADLPYPIALLYMNLHMFIAWWAMSTMATLLKFVFQSWRPPVTVICTLGFFVSLIPAAFMYNALGDYFSELYPVFADNRADESLPSWNVEYLLHFIRYSIPALPLFLVGVYGYRLVTGVDWFGYAKLKATQPAPLPVTATTPVAGMIEGSKLPADAVILAIKAEQHYIQVWSDSGKDMVRYRFKDLPESLAGSHGAQVHRSWWVNFDSVRETRQSGRNLELVINNQLVVPVSLSFKNSVLSMLEREQAH
jgi:hypothetical protein